MGNLDPKILEAVKDAAPEGRISCEKAHQLAEELQVPLISIGQAADQLNIKIKKCQLGCF